MAAKINFVLFLLLTLILAFGFGVYFSDEVKSALNMETAVGFDDGLSKPLDTETVSDTGTDTNSNKDAESVTEKAPDAVVDEPVNEGNEKASNVEKKPESGKAEKPKTQIKTVSAESRFSEPEDFEYGINSADGVTLTWTVDNLSGKTINYYNVHISTLNTVGDPSYDEHTGKDTFTLNYVGPVEPGGKLVIFNLFTYQGALGTITIEDVELEYSDGTKERVEYNRSTSDSGGMDN